MPKMTWADVEKRRQELPKLSRAELARRSAVDYDEQITAAIERGTRTRLLVRMAEKIGRAHV